MRRTKSGKSHRRNIERDIIRLPSDQFVKKLSTSEWIQKFIKPKKNYDLDVTYHFPSKSDPIRLIYRIIDMWHGSDHRNRLPPTELMERILDHFLFLTPGDFSDLEYFSKQLREKQLTETIQQSRIGRELEKSIFLLIERNELDDATKLAHILEIIEQGEKQGYKFRLEEAKFNKLHRIIARIRDVTEDLNNMSDSSIMKDILRFFIEKDIHPFYLERIIAYDDALRDVVYQMWINHLTEKLRQRMHEAEEYGLRQTRFRMIPRPILRRIVVQSITNELCDDINDNTLPPEQLLALANYFEIAYSKYDKWSTLCAQVRDKVAQMLI